MSALESQVFNVVVEDADFRSDICLNSLFSIRSVRSEFSFDGFFKSSDLTRCHPTSCCGIEYVDQGGAAGKSC